MDTPGQDLYFLGVLSLGLSSLLTAINIIATTLYMRAPGLTLRRLPIFVWSMLVTSVLNLIRSEEHTSELQSLMRISYAVFCLKKKINHTQISNKNTQHIYTPITFGYHLIVLSVVYLH